METSDILKRVRQIEIKTRGLSNNIFAGQYHSAFKGKGMSFSEVREYQYGDDVRDIDWNVTARMGKPFVKTFDEEKELVLFIILDRSLSMMTGSRGRTKLEVASEAAALLTLAAEQNNSPTGAVFFDSKTGFSCAPKSGKNHSMLIYTKLDSLPEKTNKGSSLQGALKAAQKILKKRGTAFFAKL